MTKCQAHYAPLLGFFKAIGDEVIREVYLHSFPFNNLISDEVAGSVSAPVKLMERVFTATGEHSRSHSHSGTAARGGSYNMKLNMSNPYFCPNLNHSLNSVCFMNLFYFLFLTGPSWKWGGGSISRRLMLGSPCTRCDECFSPHTH